jgi:putative cardiolipin synthase
MKLIITKAALLLAISLLCGCVSVPFQYPRQSTQYIPASADTVMGADALQWSRDNGNESGFLGLRNGTEALGARLQRCRLMPSTS